MEAYRLQSVTRVKEKGRGKGENEVEVLSGRVK